MEKKVLLTIRKKLMPFPYCFQVTVEHSYNKPEIPGQTVCYKQEFVISGQFSMRYCSTWLRSLLCYIKKFVIEVFVIRVFRCILFSTFLMRQVLSRFIIFWNIFFSKTGSTEASDPTRTVTYWNCVPLIPY